MSMPGEFDFTDQHGVWVGATWTRQFTWEQDDGVTPIDLTGWAITLAIVNDDDTTALTLAIGTGITVATPASGALVATISAAQSTTAGVGLRRYTLSLTSGSTTVVLLTGRIAFGDSQ